MNESMKNATQIAERLDKLRDWKARKDAKRAEKEVAQVNDRKGLKLGMGLRASNVRKVGKKTGARHARRR